MSTVSLEERNFIEIHTQKVLYYVKYNQFVILCRPTFPFISFFLVVAYSKNYGTDFNA